ncbi:hypothetical protein Vretimale_10189 [Volvox reticuliferus]|uniref:Tubulin--tyrosine ligase-like protein 9 n=2 Tax=Volvox reticuliferus TaxID=1737510 RepID=A0A8J4BWV9_9CHLO|nr:hypothetical protein Vretifemale_699 [Volvox reticuliferus]GIM05789.1 hypothetical protein Vretimale_10189 [Volvox reticuliferus]
MGVRWKCDLDKPVLISNFRRRGWIDVTSEEDDTDGWDLWWANVQNIKALFADVLTRLQPHQRVNHFPNHYELTRKDLMVKNIKRYQKQIKREGGNPDDLDIIPTTFVLPQDYMLFAEEFRRCFQQQHQQAGCAGVSGGGGGATWIMKPSSRSQGKGIFLINKLSQIKQWSGASLPPALRSGADNYVVSRYIDNPLLIGGKKFDMRIYVVVTSFKPLKVYMSRLGFGRFCNVKYSAEVGELCNEFMHLTNVAIQQHGEDYNEQHGNKWPLELMRLYLEGTRGVEAADRLFADIEGVILKSLRACQNIIVNDRHCFELYGYDIIVDENLKPWLIEVNASPSLTTTTQADRLLKHRVISDTINIITPPDWLAVTDPAALPPEMRDMDNTEYPFREQVGSMRLICDESEDFQRYKAAQQARAALAASAMVAAAAAMASAAAVTAATAPLAGGGGGDGAAAPKGAAFPSEAAAAAAIAAAEPPRNARLYSAHSYGSGWGRSSLGIPAGTRHSLGSVPTAGVGSAATGTSGSWSRETAARVVKSTVSGPAGVGGSGGSIRPRSAV